MIEVEGNLWYYKGDYKCITTNGFVKRDGTAVMGRGCAKDAALRYPGFAKELGDSLKLDGNHVHYFPKRDLVTFPVKYNWWENADLYLIKRSSEELARLIEELAPGIYVLPRPGCGNGNLSWPDVKEIIKHLPDCVHVIDHAKP